MTCLSCTHNHTNKKVRWWTYVPFVTPTQIHLPLSHPCKMSPSNQNAQNSEHRTPNPKSKTEKPQITTNDPNQPCRRSTTPNLPTMSIVPASPCRLSLPPRHLSHWPTLATFSSLPLCRLGSTSPCWAFAPPVKHKGGGKGMQVLVPPRTSS